MIVLIESEQGKITQDVSFAGYMGASALNWKSQTYDVRLMSQNGIPISLPEIKDELIVPIGSVQFIKKVCDVTGVKLPEPLNIPDSLLSLTNRKVWSCKRSEIGDRFPLFVKPKSELKLFTGFVAESERDFYLYPELAKWDGDLMCSEIMDSILSEWRCYVIEGKVYNCSCYSGDSLVFPDRMIIEQGLIARYQDAPAGYALDVAVTASGTELIECNDAWSLGYYGGEFTDYFKMVKLRWLQILKTQ